jgi:NAD(P)-dependent dehydrogenase (short-subunit alcohol dehydrogenase family)
MQTETKKVALITGANTGVGYQITKSLAEEGHTVYIGSRNRDKGELAATEIGKQSKAIQLDITDSQSIDTAVMRIQSEAGYLTLLVNNAAISNAGTPGAPLKRSLEPSAPVSHRSTK